MRKGNSRWILNLLDGVVFKKKAGNFCPLYEKQHKSFFVLNFLKIYIRFCLFLFCFVFFLFVCLFVCLGFLFWFWVFGLYFLFFLCLFCFVFVFLSIGN